MPNDYPVLYVNAPQYAGWRHRRNDIPMVKGCVVLCYRHPFPRMVMPAAITPAMALPDNAEGVIPIGIWDHATIDYHEGCYALYEPITSLAGMPMNKHHSEPHPFFTKE